MLKTNTEIFMLECGADVSKYDVVEHDSASNLWVKANNDSSFLGTVIDDIITKDNKNYCFTCFSGMQEVYTSREVSLNGSYFLVEDGKVYMSTSPIDKYRYILPIKDTSESITVNGKEVMPANYLVKIIF